MSSLADERASLSRDRQAFAVRETQLAAFIQSLGLRVPAPAPGAATSMQLTAASSAAAASAVAAATPPSSHTPLSSSHLALGGRANATPPPPPPPEAHRRHAYLPVGVVAQQQLHAAKGAVGRAAY